MSADDWARMSPDERMRKIQRTIRDLIEYARWKRERRMHHQEACDQTPIDSTPYGDITTGDIDSAIRTLRARLA